MSAPAPSSAAAARWLGAAGTLAVLFAVVVIALPGDASWWVLAPLLGGLAALWRSNPTLLAYVLRRCLTMVATLFVVAALVRNLGGRLDAAPPGPGRGTTMTLTLPPMETT